LTKKLTVTAHAVSATAKEKIESAGGSITLLREPKERLPKRRTERPAPPEAEAEVEEAPAEETEPEAEAEAEAEEEEPS
jgi:ribosomal protein L15